MSGPPHLLERRHLEAERERPGFEPLEMLVESERLAGVPAKRLEHSIADQEPVVMGRDTRLTLVDELAVEPQLHPQAATSGTGDKSRERPRDRQLAAGGLEQASALVHGLEPLVARVGARGDGAADVQVQSL